MDWNIVKIVDSNLGRGRSIVSRILRGTPANHEVRLHVAGRIGSSTRAF